MARRGRRIKGRKPQKDLEPFERISRTFAVRLNADSQNANERRARVIFDLWSEHEIIKQEMIKASIKHAGETPVPDDTPVWFDELMEKQAEQIDRLHKYINRLHSILSALSDGNITVAKELTENDEFAKEIPKALHDALLNNFD